MCCCLLLPSQRRLRLPDLTAHPSWRLDSCWPESRLSRSRPAHGTQNLAASKDVPPPGQTSLLPGPGLLTDCLPPVRLPVSLGHLLILTLNVHHPSFILFLQCLARSNPRNQKACASSVFFSTHPLPTLALTDSDSDSHSASGHRALLRTRMAAGAMLLAAALAHLCTGVIAAPAPAQSQLPLAAGALEQHPLGGTPPSPPPITAQKKTAQSRKLHGRFLHITGEFRPVGAASSPPTPSSSHPAPLRSPVKTGGLTLIGSQTSTLMNSTKFTPPPPKAVPATVGRDQQAHTAPRLRTATHPSHSSMPPLTG